MFEAGKDAQVRTATHVDDCGWVEAPWECACRPARPAGCAACWTTSPGRPDAAAWRCPAESATDCCRWDTRKWDAATPITEGSGYGLSLQNKHYVWTFKRDFSSAFSSCPPNATHIRPENVLMVARSYLELTRTTRFWLLLDQLGEKQISGWPCSR